MRWALAHIDRRESLRVSRSEIEHMASAAAAIRDCCRELAERGGDIVAELAAGGRAIAEWQHYPEGEVYDPQSHAQYFYHAHPDKSRPAREPGQFHLFLRAEG